MSIVQALNQALHGPGIGLALAVGALVLLPGVLLLLTSFTRVVVVLSFVRTAIGTPTSPPNMVIVGLSLLVTAFIMQPVLSHIGQVAFMPYVQGHMSLAKAITATEGPARQWLVDGTLQQQLGILYQAQHLKAPASPASVPFVTLALGYTLSQLALAFQMAIIIYLPFLLIDFVTSSVLSSLGMMMLPPTVVSLPLKLLLFVAVGGWGMVVGTLLGQRLGG